MANYIVDKDTGTIGEENKSKLKSGDKIFSGGGTGTVQNDGSISWDTSTKTGNYDDVVRNYNNVGGSGGSKTVVINSYDDRDSDYALTEQLKKQQAANVQSLLAGLKGAYEKSMNGYDAEIDALPDTYRAAKNSIAAQNAIAARNFDERAAATGLNSGTSGQAELARSSATRAGLAGLDRDEAQARNNIELAKANLRSEYETAIAQAQADGDTALANALYQEMIRVQQLERADAALADEEAKRVQNLALQYGLADPTGLASIRSLDDLAALGASTDPVPTYTGTAPRTNPLSIPKTEPDTDTVPVTNTDGNALMQYVKNASSGISGGIQGVRNIFTALGGIPQTQTVAGSGRTSLDYSPDEGIFVWNGRTYSSVEQLLRDIEAARLTDSEMKILNSKFNAYGLSFAS